MLLALLLAAGTCRAGAPTADMRALVGARSLSAEQVQALEARLVETPTDLDARSQLIGYHFFRGLRSESDRKKRQGHVLWMIGHRPESPVLDVGFANLDPTFDGEVYYKARDLWLAAAKGRASDTAVLGNAAKFFHLYDRESAQRLLLEAAQLEPECAEWPQQLAQLLSLSLPDDPASRGKRAAEALTHYERALALSDSDQRQSMLIDAAKSAFAAGEFEKAESFARELLAAAQAPEHWNYGRATHHGNLILGRLALRREDLEAARTHLLAAGRTPGSPELNSFGPNMTLALDLLKKGEKAVVLQYLELCASFWESGKDQLKVWAATIKGGGIPDFGANLVY